MEEQILKKLQTVELSILMDIDKFCKNKDINYSLFAGTALGAIRHEGFIPWDDDIDISMSRDDYEKFIYEWNKNPLPGYYLESTLVDSNCAINHTKVRKKGTYMCSNQKTLDRGNQGIWVDIFVLEKISNNFIKKIYNYIIADFRILFSRINDDYSDSSKINKFIKYCFKIVPHKLRESIVNKCDNHFKKNERLNVNYSLYDLSSHSTFRMAFPCKMVNNYIKVKFEGELFLIYKDYDDLLRISYGNYMKLPPVNERICKHNPKFLNFGD